MSAQVDVLDTMHDCAMRLRSKKCDLFAADLDEARAAVAALIAERDALWEALSVLADEADNFKAECATCGGRGEVGGHTGQTPEQFEFVTEPCPECTHQPAPVVDDAMRELIEASYAVWYDTLGATTGGKSERLRAALARAQGEAA